MRGGGGEMPRYREITDPTEVVKDEEEANVVLRMM